MRRCEDVKMYRPPLRRTLHSDALGNLRASGEERKVRKGDKEGKHCIKRCGCAAGFRGGLGWSSVSVQGKMGSIFQKGAANLNKPHL